MTDPQSHAACVTDEATQVHRTLTLLAFVIQNGQSWSAEVEAHYRDGQEALQRLEAMVSG